MGYYLPSEILESTRLKGIEKANIPFLKLLVLAFMGGVYISLGFLAYIRVVGTMPSELGSLRTFLGACVFPVGLLGVLLAGGELTTSNMMILFVAYIKKSIPARKVLYNWVVVFLGNLIGSLFVAFFLSHYTGISEGDFLQTTLYIAAGKVNQDLLPALVSGIGCNLFVCMAVWMSFGAKDITGKILASWFPIMAFVVVGFQHVVANMFVIPAAMFSGQSSITFLDFIGNIIPVYIGNLLGGAIFFGLMYCIALAPKKEKSTEN